MQDDGGPGASRSRMDRRGLPRWQLEETATLIFSTQYDVRCPLRDISGSGFAADTALRTRVGDDAIVYVRSLGRFRAEVVRVASDHVGLRFLIEDERQIVLLERLEQRVFDQAARDGGVRDPVRH
ncbi:PilZ domain-containing protein [Roseospira marina]|uniref:PilZ domain-containing protein n=1 Tax=Roseospira marina TaxID=140057 RepID=A0A5M6IBC7_9PROT|nr:PilZ domain-containing protein [Roseospira marina]KAA5605045.1 PilZ domain-containing protein [Roseospira marina]MBB4314944.1 hypothetical protein [Roseospira marina]MBB5087944.1 hypothetical protein [Roseospira marina]